MSSYLEDAGLPPRRKYDTQMFAAKYWGTWGGKGKKFDRPNGSVGADKTLGFHSRPAKKQSLRQANRAINKVARRSLKKDLLEKLEDARKT